MKKATLIIAILTSFLNSFSQDIDDFQYFSDDYEDQLFISLGASRVRITNNEAPNPKNHITKGVTLKLDLKKVNFEKGGISAYYEHKLLGDIVWWASRFFGGKKEEFYQQEESGLSSGLLGAGSFLVNINEPNLVQFAVGANFKDYFLTSAYPTDETKPYKNPNNSTIREPAGNYYAIGPSFGARYNLINLFLIEYRTELSIPFGKLDPSDDFTETENFKNPYFFNHILEFNSSKGFFIGYEFNSFIERTKANNNTKRNEIYAGFRIRL